MPRNGHAAFGEIEPAGDEANLGNSKSVLAPDSDPGIGAAPVEPGFVVANVNFCISKQVTSHVGVIEIRQSVPEHCLLGCGPITWVLDVYSQWHWKTSLANAFIASLDRTIVRQSLAARGTPTG